MTVGNGRVLDIVVTVWTAVMKGVVVYDKSNDVAFMEADDQLRLHINAQAVARGLMKPPVEQPLNRDAVMQVLSTFMTSERFLNYSLKSAYRSVQTEDGQLFVFMQFSECIYIAINGDGTETENFLTRKLSVLNRIFHFTFGPILSELKSDNLSKRLERWNFIGQILNTWCHLYSTEETFLLEAVERLQVNPDLNCKCIGFLENAFLAMKSVDEEAIHSMLFVNSKLLSLFSDSLAPAVDISDTMMIILIIRTLFPSSSPNSDASRPASEAPCTSGNQSTDESATTMLQEDSLRYLESPSQSGSTSRTKGVAAGGEVSGRTIEGGGDISGSRSSSSSAESGRLKDEMFWTPEAQLPAFDKRVVFLRRGPVSHVPHVMHCVPISEAIVLVFICKISRVEDSVAIARLLEILGCVLAVHWTENIGSAVTVTKLLDASVKAIVNMAQYYGNPETMVEPLQAINDKWKEIYSASFAEQLEESETCGELNQRTRFDLQQMYSQVLDLFYRLFFVPRSVSTEEEIKMTSNLIIIQGRLRVSIGDYAKFLIVKSLNNFTLTSYLAKIPGLVHFLYVDRTDNHLTTTSLAIGSDRKSDRLELLAIKRNLWKVVDQMQSYLPQGYLSTTILKGNYYYNYSLWFENSMGKALTIQTPLRTTQKFLLPGIIAHNFYRKMMSKCFSKDDHPIRCYELITVHTSNMPKSLMHEQCQKLVKLLLQTSSVSSSPLPLM